MDWHDTKFQLKLTALGLVVFALLIFITFNFQKVHVDFLILSIDVPLSILILFSLIIGAALMAAVWTLRGFLKK